MENVVENRPAEKEKAFDKRVHEIDLIRGFLIILVFIDHLLNNFLIHSPTWFELTGNPFWSGMSEAMNFYYTFPARIIIRYVVLALFCLISGISCAFSRNNWKRAGEALLLGLVISVTTNILNATGLAGQNIRVDFNVIFVIGFSTLFYCFFQNKSNKSLIIATISLLLFSVVAMPLIYYFIPGAKEAYVPALWEPIGVHAQGDWMPLFPYIVFFFIGALLSRFFYKEKKSHFKKHEWERPVCFLGRHTLLIYLTHYMVLLGIFNLIDVILKSVAH